MTATGFIRPVWLNGWVFVYELSGCGFESRCSHLNFRFCASFEQGVPWYSGNYRVWIHSNMRTWHDKSIPSTKIIRYFKSFLRELFSKTWHSKILGLLQIVKRNDIKHKFEIIFFHLKPQKVHKILVKTTKFCNFIWRRLYLIYS